MLKKKSIKFSQSEKINLEIIQVYSHSLLLLRLNMVTITGETGCLQVRLAVSWNRHAFIPLSHTLVK